MATTRSAQGLENRRRRAVARVNEGDSRIEVARPLGVDVRSVRTWVAASRAEGQAGLAAATAAGATPGLAPERSRVVRGRLTRPAAEFGFAAAPGTARRGARRIEKAFGVKDHPRHLKGWPRARGVTAQKPRRVPRQRDQAEIDRRVAGERRRIKERPPRTVPTSS